MENSDNSTLFLILIILLAVSILLNVLFIWHINKKAEQKFQSWKEKDIDKVRTELMTIARQEATNALQQWKIENELLIRQDAIVRSQAVIRGKVTEHLAPHMPIFPFNPKDVRFVGSPIDFLVFDGADEGEIHNIVFLEVKTGVSSLNPRQRQIRDAVLARRIELRELRINSDLQN